MTLRKKDCHFLKVLNFAEVIIVFSKNFSLKKDENRIGKRKQETEK